MATRAFIGVGSNLGEVYNNVRKAISLLRNTQGVNVINVAPYYETEPVGYMDQSWFVNSVIEVDTNLSPQVLLSKLMDIEKMLGRVRTIH